MSAIDRSPEPATRKQLIVLGAIGVCLDIVDSVRTRGADSMIHVQGFLDDDPALAGTNVAGLPVLGGLEAVNEFPDALFVCGIGSPTSYRKRREIIARTGLPPRRFASVIHPTAEISGTARIGNGVVVLAQCSIGAGAVLEDHVLMLPHCVIGHDTSVGAHSMLAGGVTVSGRVQVGADCYLGAGAAIRDGLAIGDGSLLGLGSALVTRMPPNATFFGNPARQHHGG